jgi:hypothetical protein
MPRKSLWVYGALAVIDVLLGVATNLLAETIGEAGASVVGGTMFLAIIVTFGKLIGNGAGRRTSLVVTVAGALLLFAITTANAPDQGARPGPPAPSVSATSPSPVPTQRSLSQYLDEWRNGPVKIDVSHYNAWVSRATGDDDIDATRLDLRVGIRNESTAGIDLSTAPGSLVLIMNKSFDDDTYAVDQQRISEVPSDWYLFAVGFDNDENWVEVDGKRHPITWSGGSLGVGEEFSASSPAQNGVAYAVPPPASKSASEIDAVSPQAAHVIGVAWLGAQGTIQGYTPVEKWSGPNTMASFLHA